MQGKQNCPVHSTAALCRPHPPVLEPYGAYAGQTRAVGSLPAASSGHTDLTSHILCWTCKEVSHFHLTVFMMEVKLTSL